MIVIGTSETAAAVSTQRVTVGLQLGSEDGYLPCDFLRQTVQPGEHQVELPCVINSYGIKPCLLSALQSITIRYRIERSAELRNNAHLA